MGEHQQYIQHGVLDLMSENFSKDLRRICSCHIFELEVSLFVFAFPAILFSRSDSYKSFNLSDENLGFHADVVG